MTMEVETERQMEFYCCARADGLAERQDLPSEMTERFEERDDFLYYRHTFFHERLEKVIAREPQDQEHRHVKVTMSPWPSTLMPLLIQVTLCKGNHVTMAINTNAFTDTGDLITITYR